MNPKSFRSTLGGQIVSCPEKTLHSMSFGFMPILRLASLVTSVDFEIFDSGHHTCIKLQYSSAYPSFLIFDFNATCFIFSI